MVAGEMKCVLQYVRFEVFTGVTMNRNVAPPSTG
jgi:hypothetical protein